MTRATIIPILVITVTREDGSQRQGFQPMLGHAWIVADPSPRPRAESLSRLRNSLAALPFDEDGMTRDLYALDSEDYRKLDLMSLDLTNQAEVQRLVGLITNGEAIPITVVH